MCEHDIYKLEYNLGILNIYIRNFVLCFFKYWKVMTIDLNHLKYSCPLPIWRGRMVTVLRESKIQEPSVFSSPLSTKHHLFLNPSLDCRRQSSFYWFSLVISFIWMRFSSSFYVIISHQQRALFICFSSLVNLFFFGGVLFIS